MRPTDDNTAKIQFSTTAVAPGGVVSHVLTPMWYYKSRPGVRFLLRSLSADRSDHHFRLLSFRTRGVDGQEHLVSPDGNLLGPSDEVVVTVENLTGVDRLYHGTLVGELVSEGSVPTTSDQQPPEGPVGGADFVPESIEADPPFTVSGLLSRCRAWFAEGVARARADADSKSFASREIERLGVVMPGASPPRLLDTLRCLAADLADFASIPAKAASLYWESVASGGSGVDEREVSVGIASSPVDPAQVGDAVFQPATSFRLSRLIADPVNSVCFEVVDVKVGMNSQLPGCGAPVPGSMTSQSPEGLPFGGDVAGPGRPVTVTVRNTSASRQVFRGVLVGTIR